MSIPTTATSSTTVLKPVRFYIYTDPALNVSINCTQEQNAKALWWRRHDEFGADTFFVHMMLSHPWRTLHPEKAEVFVVPIDPVFSYHIGKECKGFNHGQRIANALRALENKKWFRRKNGQDHFWMLSHYKRLGHGAGVAWKILRGDHLWNKMVVAEEALCPGVPTPDEREQCNSASDNPWCTIPVPYLTSRGLPGYHFDAGNFSAWLERDIIFYHRASTHGQPTRKRAREVATSTEVNTVVVEDHAPQEELSHEFLRSKFCFAIRGDGPATRKFFDAIAALCIPVVISDKWYFLNAPFNRYIDYPSFTIFVPEEKWMNNLPGVLKDIQSIPLAKQKEMFDNLSRVRPLLVYLDHRGHALGALLLAEVMRRRAVKTCREHFTVHDIYPLAEKIEAHRCKNPIDGIALAEQLAQGHLDPFWGRLGGTGV
eukprot:gnl/MRDRNA2_/MRDRNA2_222413_c0_seq1.p1 gnl/MRDRNA2_/MRDRNA2_222413_c0~~gnl/MRDRNA2_/MRDRNA2_222413_c0_seq1.p1  ORF type:complete len:444 (-),score=66.72 gnl/MRDRNA2_/MRDRNA2_222413_c0_seq1:62-1345(-)